MAKRTDADLLERLKRGDRGAVREWFAAFHDDLLAYVSYKISRVKDAEELVQETFIQCLKHLPLFDGRSSISTWMKSIARHEIADYYRKKYAKKAIQTLPLHELILGRADKAAVKDSHQVSEDVRESLGRIRADYSELLMLKYVDGLSVKHIAAKLGRTVKSIEADLFRARQDFREIYALVSGA